MIAALAAVIHDEETIFVKVGDLPFVPEHVLVMLILVLLLFIRGKLVPELSALLHSLRMCAALLFFELVHIFRRVKQVCRQRLFGNDTGLSVLLFGVHIQVSRFLTIFGHEEAVLFELG